MTDTIETQSVGNQAVEDAQASTESITESSFLNSLSEDLQSDPSLADFKDVNSLAKSYISAQHMLGSSVRIPSQDASDEVKNEFYSKLTSVPGVIRLPDANDQEGIDKLYNTLGRPQSADGYKLDIGEDIPLDENAQNEFFELAHKIGLTQSQVKVLADYELNKVQEQSYSYEQSYSASEQLLKEQWGPDYNNRLQGAKATLSAYQDKYPDAVNELINSPAGNNPVILSILADMQPMLHEKGLIQGANTVQYGMTPEEALAQAKEIQNNPDHDYNSSDNRKRDLAIEKVKKLYEIAYGS